MNDDLPIIKCLPGPTDAELEAQRDAKHALEVREWFARMDSVDSLDHVPPWQVRG